MQYCEFLENYRVYTRGNETPEIVHLFCGLSTLAGAAEKRLWIDQKFFNLYLNLYILLIGPAGVIAKSTSMGLALKMLREAGFNTLEGAVIKEKIIEELLEMVKVTETEDGGFLHSSTTYIANELNVLLAAGVDMIKFLVDIYDREHAYVYKTKRSGQYEIPYPHFNMMGAAVPQWFGQYVGSDMGSTGFLARSIIVYEEKKRGMYPKIEYTDEQRRAREKCMEIIFHIANMYGEVKMSSEADEYFCAWYRKQASCAFNDYRINSYYERKNKVHILKIAALMALGDLRQEITKLDIERSIYILESIEKKMRLAYVIAGNNKLAPYIHQVVRAIDEKGGRIAISELIRMLYQDMDRDEIRNLIATMEDMGEAKRKREGDVTWLVRK